MSKSKSLIRDQYGFLHTYIFTILITTSAFVILLIVFLFCYTIDRINCAGIHTGTGREVKYAGFKCYVKEGDQFLPREMVFVKPFNANIKQENK